MEGLPDDDRDGVPDSAEPTLCGLEDRNSDLDGSCDAAGRDHTL